MTDRLEKVRARMTQTARFYIHNDLSMAALHFKDNIDAKESGEDARGGKTYEYMACAVMLAFTFEAKVNFLGWKLIPEWQEGCQPHTVNLACDDINVIWRRMLEASGLEILDTISSGEGGILFIEKVVEGGEPTSVAEP